MKKHTAIEALEARIAPAVIFTVETSTNKLVSFDSSTPGTLDSDTTITGLQANELIAAIDFRPDTGELYGLGLVDDGATRTGRLYKIAPATAVATLVGSGAFSNTLADTDRYGFDFNPTRDFIRVVNNFDENFRLDPNTGVIERTSAPISDGAATNEIVTAVAYNRNFGSSFSSNVTTLYGYDYNNDNLVTVTELDGFGDDGLLTTVARAKLGGVNFTAGTALLGFDIGGDFGGPDVAWLGMDKSGQIGAHLYTIDLATAELTDLGQIGGSARVFGGLAVQINAPAPVISTDGKTATWRDLDGDNVTLKITKGTLTPANFRMLQGANDSVALSKLTVTDPTFTGTNITITAKPGANGGDGAVNIGNIDATGVDLGNVAIGGDLVSIYAGTDAEPAQSIKALTVRSIAAYGSGPARSTSFDDFYSVIADGVGKISVAGDFSGNMFFDGGKTGSITIGGDLDKDGNYVYLSNTAESTLGKLVIKGSVIGSDSSSNTSSILLEGVGSVSIGGSVTGHIEITGTGKTGIKVGGSIVDDAGDEGARLKAKNVSTITIGGSVIGGSSLTGGSIFLNSPVAKLTIGGSLIGGSGQASGAISGVSVGSLSIKGDILGGDGSQSGTVQFNDNVGSLTVGGRIKSGAELLYITAGSFGTVSIKGSVTGSTADAPVTITGRGITNPVTAAAALAIGKLSIGGDVQFATIAAGLTGGLFDITPDAAIGAVKIGGSFIASSIAAGVGPVNGFFGDADDRFVGGNAGNAAIIARIASITIGGQIIGTIGGAPDSFGIIAEQIGALAVGKIKIPLTAAKDDLTVGFTSDVRVREL
jgi:hypothetical protein